MAKSKDELDKLYGKADDLEHKEDGEETPEQNSTEEEETHGISRFMVRMESPLRENLKVHAQRHDLSENQAACKLLRDGLLNERDVPAEQLAELRELCSLQKELEESGKTDAASDLTAVIERKTARIAKQAGVTAKEKKPVSPKPAGKKMEEGDTCSTCGGIGRHKFYCKAAKAK